VPEAITPNGDNLNDFFFIEGIQNYPGNNIQIFNRWGNKVFDMTEYDNSWQGTANIGINVIGTDLPTGTYYYILDLNLGSTEIKKGFVYIKR
jgi:gliding motility-associated-like protein